METITKYKAYNGLEFTDKSECLEYEAKCRIADEIISKLAAKPKDDGGNFSNGGGFLQHQKEVVDEVKKLLLIQANKESPHKWLEQTLHDSTVHPSWAGRMIDECCTRQLDIAWIRLSCIDADYREWGQPYYANHPKKGKQICLNAP